MQELTSLRHLVRSYITEGIANGTFCPGDKISEQKISDALGISRTPTREAMLQLNSEGLLDYFPRRGFFIRLMNEKEKNDIYEMLGLLDAYCAMTAVPKLTPKDLTRMREFTDKIDIAIKYLNLEEYGELQRAFHQVYRAKCGNDMILAQIANAESGIVPATYVGDTPENLAQIYSLINEEHREVIRLLAAGDAVGVHQYLIQTHWAPRFPQLTRLRTHSAGE